MFSTDHVPTQVEKILYSSMSGHESLSLPNRFESPHPSLPYPGRLMRLFRPIALILLSAMDRAWYQLSMDYPVAA